MSVHIYQKTIYAANITHDTCVNSHIPCLVQLCGFPCRKPGSEFSVVQFYLFVHTINTLNEIHSFYNIIYCSKTLYSL